MVKVLLALLLVYSSISAGEIMDVFAKGGMKAIQAEIDRGMTDPKYWEKKLSNTNLEFGYIENLNSLLICDKSKSSLYIYTRHNEGKFKLQKNLEAFTGKYDGDKNSEGDHKTPIGVYQLVKKLDTVDPFYGPMAYVTSYPNLYDKIRGKNGSGIWIHGLPLNGTRDSFTRGCIAIDNQELTKLSESIDWAKTLLVIDSNSYRKVPDQTYYHLLAQLYAWRYAWLKNDFEHYLSFYSSGFKRYDGTDLATFKEFKQRVFSKNEDKEITFNNLRVIPYPGNDKELFMITFDETYTSPTHTWEGEKMLLVHYSGQSLKITLEQ